MKTQHAMENLKILKAIIERMNSEIVILINAAAQVEIVIRKNESCQRKYTMLEQKVDSLIQNYNNKIN